MVLHTEHAPKKSSLESVVTSLRNRGALFVERLVDRVVAPISAEALREQIKEINQKLREGGRTEESFESLYYTTVRTGSMAEIDDMAEMGAAGEIGRSMLRAEKGRLELRLERKKRIARRRGK